MKFVIGSTSKPKIHASGFSFAEVMFAVVILGIGFIMVAAIFPVAIQQTQVNSEQSVSSAYARDAAAIAAQINTYNNAQYYNLPPTTTGSNPAYVLPFDFTPTSTVSPAPCLHGNWSAIGGSLIDTADPRVAFVPLYLKASGGASAQLYIIAAQVRNRTQYDSIDVPANYSLAAYTSVNTLTTNTAAYYPPTLVPKLLKATITAGTPSLVTFGNGVTFTLPASPTNVPVGWPGLNAVQPGLNVLQPQPIYTANATFAVGTGAYFIVGNDNLVAPNSGTYNGKVYRVGNQRLDIDATGNTWQLLPGEDFSTINSIAPNGPVSPYTPWDVWMVGRGLDPNSTSANPQYSGAVQDTGLYTTYIGQK